ncbi:MAG: DUF6434 domain-containing protein [Longibaculum sp.]
MMINDNQQRPQLDKSLDSQTFLNYYYLKEELVDFCKQNGLPTFGNKVEITKRIAYFLDTGKTLSSSKPVKKTIVVEKICEESLIEENFKCSEKHRAFFKEKIGKSFSFQVPFQKWLKANAGKTYQDAINAYYQIQEEKKTKKTTIDKQFEYNTYIRDFFNDNQGKTLQEAILCWKYKKSKAGRHQYEKDDLKVLIKNEDNISFD